MSTRENDVSTENKRETMEDKASKLFLQMSEDGRAILFNQVIQMLPTDALRQVVRR